MTFLIDKQTVVLIIGFILFEPDDVAGITSVIETLSIFKPVKKVHEHSNANKSLNRDQYMIKIKAPRRFPFCVRFISNRSRITMVSVNMQYTRDESGISFTAAFWML